jgi:putative membrane protein
MEAAMIKHCMALMLGAACATAMAQLGNPAGLMPAAPLAAPGQPAPHTTNVPDRLFTELMSASGAAEVESAQLAEARSRHAGVQALARRLHQDHAPANERLLALAKQDGLAPQAMPDAEHKATRARLEGLSGSAFDLAWLQAQIVDHQKTATLLEWEIDAGQDAELQRHAAAQLPMVLDHLMRLRELMAELTGSAGARSPG